MNSVYSNNYHICRICGESNYIGCRRCQNCRVLIRRNNRANSVAFSNNRRNNNNNININNINQIENNEVKIDRPIYIEELEVKKMNFNLYNKENNKLEPKICCICQEAIEYGNNIYLLSCNHCFHQNCLKKWFNQKSECPYCRKRFILRYKDNTFYKKFEI